MLIGTVILGYKLEERLGEGGMGIVYRGVHPDLGHEAAIKVLDPLLARNSEIRERFIQEARIQIGLRHSGIVQVHTADTTGAYLALIMEYINGLSLEDVIQHRGRIPIEEALPLFQQILEAVEYAHNKGIVHRDLKPSNIMVEANGTIKVMDFGIARVLGNSRLTRTGTVMGSAPYMSPEQIQGQKHIDNRTDIYSLGITLYEMITGRTPFEGKKDSESDFKIKLAHVQEIPPDPRLFIGEIPAHIVKLLMKCLAKSPSKRFQTVREVIDTLYRPSSKIVENKTSQTHNKQSESIPRETVRKQEPILTKSANKEPLDTPAQNTVDPSDIKRMKKGIAKVPAILITLIALLFVFVLLYYNTEIFHDNQIAKVRASYDKIITRVEKIKTRIMRDMNTRHHFFQDYSRTLNATVKSKMLKLLYSFARLRANARIIFVNYTWLPNLKGLLAKLHVRDKREVIVAAHKKGVVVRSTHLSKREINRTIMPFKSLFMRFPGKGLIKLVQAVGRAMQSKMKRVFQKRRRR